MKLVKTLKIIALAIGIVWISMATNYIALDEAEENFLRHHWWARVLVVYVVAFAALDLSSHTTKEALLMSAIITAGYYLLAEL